MASEILAGLDADFPPGKMVMVAGAAAGARAEVGVVRLKNGELRAVRNFCPHKGAPICRGTVGGTWPPSEPGTLRFEREGEVLVCPWHGYEYDLRTGDELFQPAPTRLKLYPVSVRDGHVYVTL